MLDRVLEHAKSSTRQSVDRDQVRAVIEGALSQLYGLVGGGTSFEILGVTESDSTAVIKLAKGCASAA